MSITPKYLLLFFSSLFLGKIMTGQGEVINYNYSLPASEDCTITWNRQVFHDDVDKAQKKVMNGDGKEDSRFSPSSNEEVNAFLTHTITTKIDQLQCFIEKDTSSLAMEKIRYLRGLQELLLFYYSNLKQQNYKASLLPDVINTFEQCLKAIMAGEDISPIIERSSYYVGYTVIYSGNILFDKVKGYAASKLIITGKSCEVWPERCFAILKNNPDVPFADSLVKVMGKKYPAQLYNYAQASNKLGHIIRNINDDKLVQSVVQMATSRNGQWYFPFLDNIVSGKLTLEQIDSVRNDETKYFRLLVNTHIDYVSRAQRGDTAFEYNGLTERMEKKAVDVFVNTINALHFENDVVRYKIIQPLTAQELYYVAIAGDGVIYTSSFVNGVYPLMMKKISNRGDSLLGLVLHDRYRRFIKMAAGYNTLGDFLKSYPNTKSTDSLMTAFVSNLEKSNGLEDGVDVADSYGSLVESLKPVAKQMLVNIEANYQRNLKAKNDKGVAIYHILKNLFYSADSTIDLTKELGVPPVYQVPYSSLADTSGRVYMQVFFYGDQDGQGIFSPFLNMFSNASWRVDGSNPQWVTITSTRGKPVTIYANRPLPEETGEDEAAQVALGEYLRLNNINPTVTIHRGHSYFAQSTIEHMFPSSRIVFLGSCGGYHLNYDVLAKSPDAHIISSKQIGKFKINVPFFKLLTDKVVSGKDIEWIPFWKEFGKMVSVDGFEDYIAPYKNLGAIYIKAYKIAMEKNDENIVDREI